MILARSAVQKALIAVAAVARAATLCLAAGPLLAFPDAPPAGTTGGFGEDSCFACHFDGTPNDGRGKLTLSGLPERYEGGETYTLTLSLTHPEMAVAGFLLAIRHVRDGNQAGRLDVPTAESSRVGLTEEREITFAHHLLDGTALEERHEARWSIDWTASASAEPVVVHVSAVAGDGDASQAGDHVYTLERAAEARRP
jgi:hypothetical protein